MRIKNGDIVEQKESPGNPLKVIRTKWDGLGDDIFPWEVVCIGLSLADRGGGFDEFELKRVKHK